ncbi:hypothetical protein AVEN_164453-1 [Araneus ventricosus]|uniref:RING-type domain-containing protein n=1 Tax=Araneus ventricosus TaxID=182803 RepID=A0A4Y2PLF0_ARAVE|nr:hypothetical protein AVEN_250678-1 [Araneus ventricosus]GBN51340.1 hypothetical protein AVEN_164453-1 [Araneus ventricosus]
MSDDAVQLENVEFVQSCPAQFRCRRCSSLDSALQRARCGHGFCGRCVNMVRAARFQCPVDSRSVEKKEVSSLQLSQQALKSDIHDHSTPLKIDHMVPQPVVNAKIR